MSFSASQYVQMTVKTEEEYVLRSENQHLKLLSRAEMPLMTLYQPELDILEELGPSDPAYYQALIGILKWIVENGQD